MLNLKRDIDKTIYNMIRKSSIGTSVLRIFNIILVFGINFFLAKLIGAKEYGIYAYTISWASIWSMISLFGLHLLVVREVPIYKTKKEWHALKELLWWSIKFIFFSSIIIALLGSLILFLTSKKEFSVAIWFGMLLIPILSFIYLLQGMLRGLGSIIKAQIPQFFILPFFFLLMVLIFSQLNKLSGIFAIKLYIISAILGLLTAIYLLKNTLSKNYPFNNLIFVSKSANYRNWIKSAFPLFISSTGQIINQRVSTVILGSLLGAKEAGIFDITFRIANFINFPLMVVNMPLAPIIAKFYAENEYNQLQNIITKSARVTFSFSLILTLVFILFGKELFLLIGKDFSLGYSVFVILSIGFLINVATGSVMLLLNMTKYEFFVAKVIVISSLINLILNFILIPKFHIIGAAIANIIATILWNVLLAIGVYKKLSIYPTILGKIF